MKAVAFSSMQICFVTKGGIGGLAGRELQSLRGEVAPGASSGKRADGTGRRKDPLTKVRGCTEWQFTAAAVRNLRIRFAIAMRRWLRRELTRNGEWHDRIS